MLKMFTIYDSKTECYDNPFCGVTRGDVLREFINACNDEKSKFSKYPSDFTIFEIGEYDQASGITHLYEAKQNLGLALDFKKSLNQPRGGQPPLTF